VPGHLQRHVEATTTHGLASMAMLGSRSGIMSMHIMMPKKACM